MKIRFAALAVCMILIAVSFASCAKPTGVEAEDLNGLTIAVVKGSESIALATEYKNNNGCELTGFETAAELLSALTDGDADCAIIDKNIAEEFVKEHPEFCISESTVGTGNVRFTTLESKKVYSIMLQKALKALKEDGTVDSIVNGYLTDPNYKYEFTEEIDGSNGQFKIALDVFFEPYLTLDNGAISGGIQLALIDAMCTYLGCDYSLLPTSTGSLANALRLGEADFVIGAFDHMEGIVTGAKLAETEPIFTFDYVIVSKKAEK